MRTSRGKTITKAGSTHWSMIFLIQCVSPERSTWWTPFLTHALERCSVRSDTGRKSDLLHDRSAPLPVRPDQVDNNLATGHSCLNLGEIGDVDLDTEHAVIDAEFRNECVELRLRSGGDSEGEGAALRMGKKIPGDETTSEACDKMEPVRTSDSSFIRECNWVPVAPRTRTSMSLPIAEC